jgi:hypothetical protein
VCWDGVNCGFREEPTRKSQNEYYMAPSPDIDPQELALPDIADDMNLSKGPVIDTSDEFPLPDFGEEPDPKVLFPEATEEDIPNVASVEKAKPIAKKPEAKKPEEPKKLELKLPSLDDVGKRSWSSEGKPLSEMSFPSSDIQFSEDDDYFEPQLQLVRQPSAEPESLAPLPPLPPLPPAVVMDERSRPAPAAPAAPASPPVQKAAKAEVASPAEETAPPKSSETENSPVAKYVRKVKVKRKGEGGRKVRPWVPIAGVIALGVGYFASQPFLADLEGQVKPAPVLIVASEPRGEVFAGETSLGKTPIAFTTDEVAPGMEVRLAGHQTMVVPEVGQRDDNKPPQKFMLQLVQSPVVLSWDGLPEGSTVWWNGEKKTPAELKEMKPGKYSVKAKPSDRPAVSLEIALEPTEGPFQLGQALQAELAKQPSMTVSLTLPEKAKAEGLGISVKSLDEAKPFKGSLKVSGDSTASLTVPEAGKYKISFAGDKSFKPTSQTVELASGATEEFSLKLDKKPPPKVTPTNTSGGGPAYRPSRPAYRPTYRPTYRPSGGGSGRIRPPSF